MNLKIQAGVRLREYKGKFCFSYFQVSGEGDCNRGINCAIRSSSFPLILKIAMDFILGFRKEGTSGIPGS